MTARNGQSLAQMSQYAQNSRVELERQANAIRQNYAAQTAQVNRIHASQLNQSLALTRQIVGSLAREGDNQAAQTVRASIKRVGAVPCTDEVQMAVQMETLGSLSKVDLASARSRCCSRYLDPARQMSHVLRERAVFTAHAEVIESAARQARAGAARGA